MNDHTRDCRIHDDGACCDCGHAAANDVPMNYDQAEAGSVGIVCAAGYAREP